MTNMHYKPSIRERGITRKEYLEGLFLDANEIAPVNPIKIYGYFYTSEIAYIKKRFRISPDQQVDVDHGSYYCEFYFKDSILSDAV